MDTAVHNTPDATPEPHPRASASAPQLRTLLLTDLVDSTGLIERLGDSPASELFRAHDRLVLQLQQQWRGRLIDRSDGLLLLFERPIDGLGFALDYTRGLIVLGNERGVELRARAGLHVGEVLTWRNSDEAVSVGAKPLEVEGLAKPMAARLMAMARPGQILLSAVAEPLAHRAARELGERGQHLIWKSWGRWRFKGVPELQEIFEVGEPGVAPLRIPPSSPKAWRDIPIWRRPAMLAAEAAAVLGIAVGIWFIARPEPAIAFNQRDWVVVGDLRNLTGQTALDDSLEQAFRISLEQSRYVNVLSDLKARDTLGRMRREPNTVLDRAIASEIAIREGARAVILPTVAEVGGRVRVSAEVIDPRTQTTVYAESADGRGFESTLHSIDKVTASLRGELGEAVKSITSDSVPLPQVTTGNLDALRAYALGQKAYGRRHYSDALKLFERATSIDSKFALAWLGQVRAYYSEVDARSALIPLRRAQELRAHLAPREALYLDAWGAYFDSPAQVTEKWLELARLYPDYGPALSNASFRLGYENRHKEALELATAASKIPSDNNGYNFDAIGRSRLALGQYREATTALESAIAAGATSSLRRRVAVEAAQRKFLTANKLQYQLPSDDRHAYIERTSLALDQGHWREAQKLSRQGLALANEGGYDSRLLLMPVAVADWAAGDNANALKGAKSAGLKAMKELTKERDPDAEDDATLAIAAALLAQRLGDAELGKEVLAQLDADKALAAIPNVAKMSKVLRAERLRILNKPAEAIALLSPLLDGNEQFQVHVALMEAYATAGEKSAAIEQARWLQSRRGLAYGELDCGYCRQSMNILDSNRAALRAKEWLNVADDSASKHSQPEGAPPNGGAP